MKQGNPTKIKAYSGKYRINSDGLIEKYWGKIRGWGSVGVPPWILLPQQVKKDFSPYKGRKTNNRTLRLR